MTREEGHLVVICVWELSLMVNLLDFNAAVANVNGCILGYIQ